MPASTSPVPEQSRAMVARCVDGGGLRSSSTTVPAPLTTATQLNRVGEFTRRASGRSAPLRLKCPVAALLRPGVCDDRAARATRHLTLQRLRLRDQIERIGVESKGSGRRSIARRTRLASASYAAANCESRCVLVGAFVGGSTHHHFRHQRIHLRVRFGKPRDLCSPSSAHTHGRGWRAGPRPACRLAPPMMASDAKLPLCALARWPQQQAASSRQNAL